MVCQLNNTNNVISTAPQNGHSQSGSNIIMTYQEVVPLLVNKKSHYNSFKMNIKLHNMCRHAHWYFGHK